MIYSWKTSSGDDVELVLTDHGEQLYIEKVLYRDREYTADFVMRSGEYLLRLNDLEQGKIHIAIPDDVQDELWGEEEETFFDRFLSTFGKVLSYTVSILIVGWLLLNLVSCQITVTPAG